MTPFRKFYDAGQGSITYSEGAGGGGAPPGFINVAGAKNGLTVAAGDFIVLGQDVTEPGDPGKLLSNREIPTEGFQLQLRGTGIPDQGVLSFTQDAQALWDTVLPDPGAGNAVQNLIGRVRPLVQAGGGAGAVDWIMSHSATNFFGVVDEVINFGWNIAPGGGPEILGRPGIGFSLESYFSPSGNPLTSLFTESHQFYINPAGLQIRISSFTIDTLTDTINYEMTVANWNLQTNPGPGQFVYAAFVPGQLTMKLDAAHQFTIEISAGNTEFAGAGFLLITGFTSIAFPSFSIAGTGNVKLVDTGTGPGGGAVYPEADLNYNLGGASNRFNELFVQFIDCTSYASFGLGPLGPSGNAWVEVGSNTAARAQILLDPGGSVLLTTPRIGSVEFDGNQLYFTPGANREVVFMGQDAAGAPGTTPGITITNFYGTSAANFLGDPDSWAAVIINGTTYKIPLYK